MTTLWKYIKWLSPGRLLLLKKAIDALEILLRLLEKLFDKTEDNPKPDPKE
jgi:hypothetical protein